MKDITPEKAIEMLIGLAKSLDTSSYHQNFTKEGEGFYLSFNPYTDQGAETALVKKNGEGEYNFFILLGNYVDSFDVALSFEENKKIYDQLIRDGAKESPWSE